MSLSVVPRVMLRASTEKREQPCLQRVASPGTATPERTSPSREETRPPEGSARTRAQRVRWSHRRQCHSLDPTNRSAGRWSSPSSYWQLGSQVPAWCATPSCPAPPTPAMPIGMFWRVARWSLAPHDSGRAMVADAAVTLGPSSRPCSGAVVWAEWRFFDGLEIVVRRVIDLLQRLALSCKVGADRRLGVVDLDEEHNLGSTRPPFDSPTSARREQSRRPPRGRPKWPRWPARTT